jgi:multidrug efflux pump subunit AcrA (membrane-fusion protein)
MWRWPRVAIRCVLTLTLLGGCGITPPQSQTSQPLIDRAALAPNARVVTAITETVRRGTIRDTLTIPGKVSSAQSAELLSRGAGTVSALNVRAGQAVARDAVLAEITLDPEAIESARSRAVAADLALEQQLARVEDLRKGAGAQALSSARADLSKARSELTRAQVASETQRIENAEAERARTASKEAADRQVELAQLALDQAEDDLTSARAEVARAQAPTTQDSATPTPAPAANDTLGRAQDQAEADLAAASAAQRGAERHVEEALLRLREAQAKPNERKAQLDAQIAEAQLGRAERDLKAAQADAEQHDSTKDPTGVIAAAAVDKIKSATRDFELAQELVVRTRDELGQAKTADQRASDLAQLGLDQAQDELAAARAALTRTQRAATRVIAEARLTATPASVTPTPQVTGTTVKDILTAAQAKVRSVERQVQMARLKVQEAQAAQAAPPTAQDGKTRVLELDVQSAQAGVDAAQARLAELERGPAVASLEREQRRADVLRDEADAAHQALTPVQALASPFDAIATAVNVQLGQAVDSRTSVARLVSGSGLSVIANASERDVTYLRPTDQVELSFPGLGDERTLGRITEIGESATADTPPAANGREQVTYPVHVELPSPPGALKLGMSAMLNVQLGEAANVLYVSSGTLRKLDGYDVLTLVASDGSLKDVTVEVGRTYGNNVAILSGVSEGDIVAVVAPASTTAASGTALGAPKP